MNLTAHELDVVRYLASGVEVKDIAARTHRSPKTVEFHSLRARTKLRLFNLADLTRWAIRNGIVTACLMFSCFAGQVRLAWEHSPDATGYVICYGPSDNLSVLLTNDVGYVTACTVSNLAVGQSYDFYAKAYDSSGVMSEPSNTVSGMVALTIVAVIEESADLIWWVPLTNTAVAVTTTNAQSFYRARMEER